MGSVLLDDVQVALDQAAVVASRLTIAYRDAAGLIEDDPELANLFESLAAERQDLAESLVTLVEALGALPSEPDPDREDLLKLVRHARAALSNDERLALIREAERHEDALAEALSGAQSSVDDDQPPAAIGDGLESVKRAHQRLAAARSRAAMQS